MLKAGYLAGPKLVDIQRFCLYGAERAITFGIYDHLVRTPEKWADGLRIYVLPE